MFALSRFPSPFRLATMADTATFREMKTARPMNFGWVVSPTAAMAYTPRELTIKVSTIPTRLTRKDSMMDGHAMRTVPDKISRSAGSSPKTGCFRRIFRAEKRNKTAPSF